jgi:hypothetical protein
LSLKIKEYHDEKRERYLTPYCRHKMQLSKARVLPEVHKPRSRSELKVECHNCNKQNPQAFLDARRKTLDSKESQRSKIERKLKNASFGTFDASRTQESTSLDADKEWDEKQEKLFKERLEMELRSLNPIIGPERRRKRFDLI